MTLKRLNIRGVEWEYATGGRGERTLLMFHGAVGGAESMQWLAGEFAGRYRTIAPTVAHTTSLAEVADAASAILDKEHVGRAVVFGGSFGGMVAQAFAHRHARQVEDLILLSTGAPSRRRGARNERYLRLMRLLPFPLVRALMKAELLKHLDAPVPPEAAERVAQFKARLRETLTHGLSKELFLTRIGLSIDFDRHERYAPEDLAGWPGRVLIFESDDDPMINEEERASLRALYPRAMVCAFEGTGHMIPLLKLEELVHVMRAFVERTLGAAPCPDHAGGDFDSCPAGQ